MAYTLAYRLAYRLAKNLHVLAPTVQKLCFQKVYISEFQTSNFKNVDISTAWDWTVWRQTVCAKNIRL